VFFQDVEDFVVDEISVRRYGKAGLPSRSPVQPSEELDSGPDQVKGEKRLAAVEADSPVSGKEGEKAVEGVEECQAGKSPVAPPLVAI